MPNFLLASHVDPNLSFFASEKCLGGCSAYLHNLLFTRRASPPLQLLLILLLYPSVLSPPSALTALINFQTLICEAKCVVSPPLVTPLLRHSVPLLFSRWAERARCPSGSWQRSEERRRVGQVSSEKQKKKTAVFERWSSLAA